LQGARLCAQHQSQRVTDRKGVKGSVALVSGGVLRLVFQTQPRSEDIAFPKTAKGMCLMTDSSSTVEPKQLRDLHIKLKVKQPTLAPAPKA